MLWLTPEFGPVYWYAAERTCTDKIVHAFTSARKRDAFIAAQEDGDACELAAFDVEMDSTILFVTYHLPESEPVTLPYHVPCA